MNEQTKNFIEITLKDKKIQLYELRNKQCSGRFFTTFAFEILQLESCIRILKTIQEIEGEKNEGINKNK